jgi:diguanylate cyclase (GGDEF)-like protein
MPQRSSDLARAPRASLARKIIFFVLLSMFATALAMVGIPIHSTYTYLRQRIDETYPLVLERSAERLSTWLEEGREEVAHVAASGPLADRLRARVDGQIAVATPDPVLTDALKNAFEGTHGFSGLVLLDAEGALLAAAGQGPEFQVLLRALEPKTALSAELVDIMHAAGVREQLSRVEQPGFTSFAPPDQPALPLASVPVRDAEGNRLGSLHGLFERDGLAAELRTDWVEASGHVYLADAAGRVVAAAREEQGVVESFPVEVLTTSDMPRVREFSDSRGHRSVGSTLPLPALGWTLVAHQTVDQAFQPVVSTLGRILLISLAVFVLAAVLAGRIAAAIVRPINALYEGARRISQGELDVEMPPTERDDEIGLLTRTFNDMARRLRQSHKETEASQRALREQNEAFQRMNEVLSQLAITDGLTKLHNHRYFQEQLTRELKRIERSGEPLSILILDIDDFKKLNDRFGHTAGDEFLVRFAEILNECIRESDLAARYGGEEFVVVALDTDEGGAVTLAEKIRTAVAESSFILGASMRPLRVTVSIGVSQYRGSRKGLFEAADEALYRAKAAGKNCVISSGVDDPVALSPV